MMKFDYRKLRGKIVEVYGKASTFAKAMGISEHTLSKKLTNKISFKQEEIMTACNLLGIECSDIPIFFYTLQIQCT